MNAAPKNLNASKKNLGALRTLIVIGVFLVLLIIIFSVLILSSGQGPAQNNNNVITEAINEAPANEVSPNNNITETASSEVAGANIINLENKVVNDKGTVVVNDAKPMTDAAPRLSAPIAKDKIPEASVKLTADANGFRPSEFRVKAGQPVTLVLTADGVGSRLIFDDITLSSLEIPVPSGYTMAKTFNAPTQLGEYTFHQDMPNRSGQTGKMIVQ